MSKILKIILQCLGCWLVVALLGCTGGGSGGGANGVPTPVGPGGPPQIHGLGSVGGGGGGSAATPGHEIGGQGPGNSEFPDAGWIDVKYQGEAENNDPNSAQVKVKLYGTIVWAKGVYPNIVDTTPYPDGTTFRVVEKVRNECLETQLFTRDNQASRFEFNIMVDRKTGTESFDAGYYNPQYQNGMLENLRFIMWNGATTAQQTWQPNIAYDWGSWGVIHMPGEDLPGQGNHK